MKVSDKIQHPFIIKSSQQARNTKELLQYDKRHLRKATASIIHNDKILNIFLLCQEQGKDVCSPTSIQHGTGGPDQCNKARERKSKKPEFF